MRSLLAVYCHLYLEIQKGQYQSKKRHVPKFQDTRFCHITQGLRSFYITIASISQDSSLI